jgi:F0F1-type ATP synthase gamma subunit
MINIKTLKQKINLLEYIQKTLKSVESINLNKRAVLKKESYKWAFLKETILQLNGIVPWTAEKKSSLLIIVGSDSSLCGSYNSNLIKYCNHWSGNLAYDKIIILGKKVKKIIIEGPVEYHDYKNFSNNLECWYQQYGFNVDIIGYHTKDIALINLMDTIGINHDNHQHKDKDLLIEGSIGATYGEIVYQLTFMEIIYNIENQENIQRLMFLKSSIDNCQEEIQNTVKKYRSLRQENITKEINELIGANMT